MESLETGYVKKLPPPLRAKYLRKKRSTSRLQEVMEIIVALYLWQIGHRQIEFEYYIDGGGHAMYPDVCDLDGKIIVECVKEADVKDIAERYNMLKAARPDYKIVIAVRDVNGWWAGKYLNACDDIWVLRMNGDVIAFKDWPSWRIHYLLEPLNREKLELLNALYEWAVNEYEHLLSLKERDIRVVTAIISYVLESIDLPRSLLIKPGQDKFKSDDGVRIETLKKFVEGVRREMLRSLIELINRLMEIAQPYRLELLPDNSISIKFNSDMNLWLGNEFTTNDKLGWKNLEKEVEILQQHLPKKGVNKIAELARRAGEIAEEALNGKVKILDEDFKNIILTML